MAVTTIVFDVYGVLVRDHSFAGRSRWERRLGLAEGRLTEIVMGCEPAARAATGEIPESLVWKAVAAELGIPEGQIPDLQRDFWSSEELEEDLVRFIRRLRRTYRIGILSNAWSDARAFHVARFAMDTWTDAAVYSAEEGLVKPDPAIYRLLMTRMGASPRECLFVDDRPENVDAAVTLGMTGIVCRTTSQAIDDIRKAIDA